MAEIAVGLLGESWTDQQLDKNLDLAIKNEEDLAVKKRELGVDCEKRMNDRRCPRTLILSYSFSYRFEIRWVRHLPIVNVHLTGLRVSVKIRIRTTRIQMPCSGTAAEPLS